MFDKTKLKTKYQYLTNKELMKMFVITRYLSKNKKYTMEKFIFDISNSNNYFNNFCNQAYDILQIINNFGSP